MKYRANTDCEHISSRKVYHMRQIRLFVLSRCFQTHWRGELVKNNIHFIHGGSSARAYVYGVKFSYGVIKIDSRLLIFVFIFSCRDYKL